MLAKKGIDKTDSIKYLVFQISTTFPDIIKNSTQKKERKIYIIDSKSTKLKKSYLQH